MSKKTVKKQPQKVPVQNVPRQSKTPDNKSLILVAGAIGIGIVMAVVSWMILPDSVATQFKGMSTGAPNVPKIVAVALPLGITVVCAIQSLKVPDSIKICLVGYAANILFWLSNL